MRETRIGARGASRLRRGHPWIYRSDFLDTAGVGPGELVVVRDSSGNTLGTALYSSASEIAARMLSDKVLAAEEFPAVLCRRIAAAVDWRARVVAPSADAYRVIFSEADLLPGLIVDRFNDVLSFQALTQAMDTEAVRGVVLEELQRHFAPAGIVERVDERIRELEQLPPRKPGLLAGGKTRRPGRFSTSGRTMRRRPATLAAVP
jgi:23S rRNA (cytosine1962-C5)-methyltransferase